MSVHHTEDHQDARLDRLQELLDHHDISRILVLFARRLDEKDFVGYAELYAQDGTLTTPRATHRGRIGLAEHVEGDLGDFVATHHVCASRDISVEGDSATVRSSLHATHVRSVDASDFWVVGGWYDVSLRRGGPHGWEITSVVINPTWRFDTREPVPGTGLSARDWLAIESLYAKYAAAIDEGDSDGFAALFEPDAQFHHPDGRTVITELAAFCSELAEERRASGTRTRHWAAHFVATPMDDSVRIRCNTAVTGSRGDGGYVTIASGHNADDLTRQPDGTWRFLRRRALPDLPFG